MPYHSICEIRFWVHGVFSFESIRLETKSSRILLLTYVTKYDMT